MLSWWTATVVAQDEPTQADEGGALVAGETRPSQQVVDISGHFKHQTFNGVWAVIYVVRMVFSSEKPPHRHSIDFYRNCSKIFLQLLICLWQEMRCVGACTGRAMSDQMF